MKIINMLVATGCSAVAASAAYGGTLEEVIVTAQKWESSVQKTPIALSAFTGQQLQRAQIVGAPDLQMNVPNLTLSRGNFTTTNIAIRGVGLNAIGTSADSAVGVHQDGVYMAQGRIFETEFYDTERLEILRGPQGTLYGRNTTGGVINIISNKPTTEKFGGSLDVQLGNYQTTKVKGAANVPLTDRLATRFAGFYLQRDGYTKNLFDGNRIDDRDMYSLRWSTQWDMTDQSSVNLLVQHFEEDDHRMRGQKQKCQKDPDGILGCLPNRLDADSVNSAGTFGGFLSSAFGGGEFPEDDYANSINPTDAREVYMDFTPRYEVEETLVALEFNVEFAGGKLTSVSGYHKVDFNSRGDYDKTVASESWPVTVTTDLGPDGEITTDYAYGVDYTEADPEQWSQELRFSSSLDGSFNFLVGAFYLELSRLNHFTNRTAGASWAGRDLFGLPENTHFLDSFVKEYKLETGAVFGELYWDIGGGWDATVGLRYSDERKEQTYRTVLLIFLDDPNAEDGGFSYLENDWQETTGKVNVNYQVDDDTLLYGIVSRSYKGGGFNSISASSPTVDPEQGGDPSLFLYDPEYVDALELGLKSRYLDNTLQLNLAGFYYDFEGTQVSSIITQSPITTNLDSETLGLEGEFVYQPDERWTMSLNLTWLDTKIKNYSAVDVRNPNQMGTTEGIVNGPSSNTLVSCGCPGIEADLNGNQLPQAPEYTAQASLSYLWPVGDRLNLRMGTSYYWQDEFYAKEFNTSNDLIDSWNVWNATANLHSTDGAWYVELFVKNILDDDNVTGQYTSDPVAGLFTNQFIMEPRTYGLNLGYHF